MLANLFPVLPVLGDQPQQFPIIFLPPLGRRVVLDPLVSVVAHAGVSTWDFVSDRLPLPMLLVPVVKEKFVLFLRPCLHT